MTAENSAASVLPKKGTVLIKVSINVIKQIKVSLRPNNLIKYSTGRKMTIIIHIHSI